MTRFPWIKSLLAVALAFGLSGAGSALAEDDFDDAEADFDEPAAAALVLRDLDIQLSEHDDEEFPGAFLVSFEVTGGESLNTATGFLVEDVRGDHVVFEEGYLDTTDDASVLVGVAAWPVGLSDCGTTRNLRVVVVSEEYTEGDDVIVTRLAQTEGRIQVPAEYCTEGQIETDG